MTQGLLQGTKVTNLGVTFFAFKGVPYGETTEGANRFKAPVARKSWTGVKSAANHGNYCPNKEGFWGLPQLSGGNEKCLNLNIYTRNMGGNLPVMFHVHAGTFASGNGNSFLLGPEYIVNENVVLITVNFRLSSLGFLSANDANAQGNQGIKDVIMALRWVNNNIQNFGGNKGQVTIFGQGAGAQLVSILLMTPLTVNLFHQAIMQSGNALSLNLPDPLARMNGLTSNLGIDYNSTSDVIEKLRNVSTADILKAERGVKDMQKPYLLKPLDFLPVVEAENVPEEKVLLDTPLNLMTNGNFHKLPIMMGINNLDGSVALPAFSNPLALAEYNLNIDGRVPSFDVLNDSKIFELARSAINEQYFQTGGVLDWLRFYTDFSFRYPLHKFLTLYKTYSDAPAFCYEFSYVGKLNLADFWYTDTLTNAFHGDELNYLFNMAQAVKLKPDSNAKLVRAKMVMMWTNFAKFG